MGITLRNMQDCNCLKCNELNKHIRYCVKLSAILTKRKKIPKFCIFSEKKKSTFDVYDYYI